MFHIIHCILILIFYITYFQINIILIIIHIINKNYVDDVKTDSLKHLPIDSLLHQLDPHSIYLPAKKASRAIRRVLNEASSGS